MVASGGLIWHVIKALYYLVENFLFKQVRNLVVGASKSFLKNNKVFALRAMLAGGGLIHQVMKVNLLSQCLTHE